MINLSKPSLEKCEHCLFRQIVRQFINEEEFQLLYNSSIQLRYKKGETILKQNSQFSHIVFLSKGYVKFNYENEFGKNLILTIVDSPTLLGGINVFNEATNMFSIIAIEECEACLIDINVLKNLALQNSALALRLLEFSSAMFKDSILNFISLAHKHVNGRVADILIYLSEKIYKNKEFILTLTRKELAEFAGCSSENIIHTLTRFHKEGIIHSEGKMLKITDLARLSEISRLG
jgi:CRP/FNR family transcriptional regulator